MRVLVLGGNGFIGINLTKRLLNDGHNVTLVDINENNLIVSLDLIKNKKLKFINADYSDSKMNNDIFDNNDVCFHLASTTVPFTSNNNIAHDIEHNLIKNINFLRKIQKSRISKIIFLSSGGAVYGISQSPVLSEDHPTNPISSYGIVKLALEKYIHLFSKKSQFDYVILRASNPFGPFQSPLTSHGVVPKFIKKIHDDSAIEIWGDGSIIKDFIYIDDLVSAMVISMGYSGEKKVFNIGCGSGTDINSLIIKIEMITKRKANKIYLNSSPADVPSNVLDITLARQELGWSPKINLEDGLKLTLKWLNEVSLLI